MALASSTTIDTKVLLTDQMVIDQPITPGFYRLTNRWERHGYRIDSGVIQVNAVSKNIYGHAATIIANYQRLDGNYLFASVIAATIEPTWVRIPDEEGYDLLMIRTRKAPSSVINPLTQVSTGSDPELFVVDTNGQPIPAWKYTKISSKDIDIPAYTPYWDGLQVEYKTSLWQCNGYGVDYLHNGIKAVNQISKNLFPQSRLSAQPTFLVPPSILETAEDKYLDLGCNPSENVYNQHGDIPLSGRGLLWRFAGFHIHYDVPSDQKVKIPSIIKLLDRMVGVVSVAALAELEDPIRRQYYGLAGEYRRTNYGLEYRTLSSAVLWHPTIAHLMLNLARAAYWTGLKGLDKFWTGTDESVTSIINNLDIPEAKRHIQRNRGVIENLLTGIYFFPAERTKAILDQIILGGFKQHIDLDMEKNWMLNSQWYNHSNGPDIHFAKFGTNHSKIGK